MAVSAAKLEANRRNAQKSTGPRTQEGKDKSKMNAVGHGCRAKTLILPDEDPDVFNQRHQAWRARFGPRDSSEAFFLEEAVVNTWLLDRARRAQAARLTANLLDDGADRQLAIDREVAALGERLYTDRDGPMLFYPSPSQTERLDFARDSSTSYAGPKKECPDRPADLVLLLQSTLTGCQWLLDEWSALEEILDKGQAWLSSDKLKAVRLLGKQPFDAIDNRDVAMIYLASFALKPDKRTWYWEIAMELADKDVRRFQQKVAIRELESLMPADASAALEALRALIKQARERVNLKAEAHRERARIAAALAPDLLAFDDSKEGEWLRRYEMSCGRAVTRSLDKMLKLRADDDVELPVGGDVEGRGGQNATNEANAVSLMVELAEVAVSPDQNATNEANAVSLTVEQAVDAVSADQIVTNEPKVAEKTGRADGEPVENTTNEATDGRLPGVSLPGVSGSAPVKIREIAAADAPLDSTTTQGAALDLEKAGAWIVEGIEKQRALRAERLAKLNESARRERESATAARRSRVTGPKSARENAVAPSKRAKTRTPQHRQAPSATSEEQELDMLMAVLTGALPRARSVRASREIEESLC